MIGEIIIDTPLGVKLQNDKEDLTNIVNNLFSGLCEIKSVELEHLYVFGTGKNGAILCYRKDSDDAEYYRGGMIFDRSDVDTEGKVRDLFFKNKDILNMIDEPYINRRKPLLLEADCISVIIDC